MPLRIYRTYPLLVHFRLVRLSSLLFHQRFRNTIQLILYEPLQQVRNPQSVLMVSRICFPHMFRLPPPVLSHIGLYHIMIEDRALKLLVPP
ncbi:hypothetical protein [Bufonid herpesvirus 1]|uniref:hypothetical protein n=1 Tax=Bufonid herpesvirus 1 TaxID=2282206 RepID=UPI000EB630FD|nr:hypothetical protein [Bufonid herpesvirus 1]AXF48583.1 hypothetical protein [Bufonid herpesvirus 1]